MGGATIYMYIHMQTFFLYTYIYIYVCLYRKCMYMYVDVYTCVYIYTSIYHSIYACTCSPIYHLDTDLLAPAYGCELCTF